MASSQLDPKLLRGLFFNAMMNFETLEWEEIRAFFAMRSFLHGPAEHHVLSDAEYNQLKDRNFSAMTIDDQRNLSLFIAGYKQAKP